MSDADLSGPPGPARRHTTTPTVWLDAWQMQCCGSPFGIGDVVRLTVDEEPAGPWLVAVLGPEAGAEVTMLDRRHGGLSEREPDEVTGRVLGIRAVACRYALDTADGAWHPEPGSASLRPVDRTDGHETESGDQRLLGYLVRLDVTAPARPVRVRPGRRLWAWASRTARRGRRAG